MVPAGSYSKPQVTSSKSSPLGMRYPGPVSGSIPTYLSPSKIIGSLLPPVRVGHHRSRKEEGERGEGGQRPPFRWPILSATCFVKIVSFTLQQRQQSGHCDKPGTLKLREVQQLPLSLPGSQQQGLTDPQSRPHSGT